MNAANFGIGGDRIEHLWWRIMNGELDAIHPKYVFVLIGTNNLLFHEANEIIDGHQKLLTELRKRLPDAQIIVFGIFPRVDSWSKHVHDRIPPINQALQNFSAQTSLHYFDLKKLFLDPETGNVPTSIMYDGLHLTSKGYQLWGEEILRILKTLEPFST